MEYSNCCGASAWYEAGICSDCGEHAEFYKETENQDQLWQDKNTQMSQREN